MNERGLTVYGRISIKSPCLLLVNAHKVNVTLNSRALIGLPFRLYVATGESMSVASLGPSDVVSAVVFSLTQVGEIRLTPVSDSKRDKEKIVRLKKKDMVQGLTSR